MVLNSNDIKKLVEVGISESTFHKYHKQLVSGSAKLDLNRACTIGDGILSFTNEEIQQLILAYNGLIQHKEVERFTPASGAATRMFKHLFNQEGNPELVEEFIKGLQKFAFFDELELILEMKGLGSSQDKIDQVLFEDGLNYGNLPKALISFH